jgi:hypothetical protein
MNDKEIIAVWNSISSDNPDISTEQLFERTAIICRCDVDDVARALWNDQKSMPTP